MNYWMVDKVEHGIFNTKYKKKSCVFSHIIKSFLNLF